MAEANKRRGRFVRIRGRAVFIKAKSEPKSKLPGAAAVVAGAAAAGEGARTKRVWQDKKKGLTVDRKMFTFQPFAPDRLGNSVILKKKGKTVGRASFYRTFDKKGDFAFSWLSTKSSERGKGYAGVLTKQAAKIMKDMGGKTVTNQVVHEGSLKANWRKKSDSLFREATKKKTKSYFGGLYKRTTEKTYTQKITKTQAKKNIRGWRHKGYLTSNVWRRTKLDGVRANKMKPFYTGRSKALMIGGAALAAAGTVDLWKKRKK